MTRREIKRDVLQQLAAMVGTGQVDWGICETPADEERMESVLKDLADEFSRRGREFA